MRWLLGHRRALLADETGLGKTVQVCGLLAALKAGGESPRVLVVAPGSELLRQWQAELARLLPGVFTVAGSHEKRVSAPSQKQRRQYAADFPNGPDIDLVTAAFLNSRPADYPADRYDLVVIDEASTLKAGGANHAAVCAAISPTARAVALTASPVENDVVEMYEILRLVSSPALWSRARFDELFVIYGPTYLSAWGEQLPPKPVGVKLHNLPQLWAYLDNHCLRRTHADVPPLPRPTMARSEVRVKPTGAQLAAIAEVKRRYSNDPMMQAQKTDDIVGWAKDDSPKARAAVRWLTDNPREGKVILYCEHLPHMGIAAGLLTHAGIGWVRVDGGVTGPQRAKALDAFRDDPAVRVLLGNVVLERGLNLQHARVLLSLGSTYNPAAERQREGRIWRMRSPHAEVLHVTFVLDIEHEHAKRAKLARKQSIAEAVFGRDSIARAG